MPVERAASSPSLFADVFGVHGHVRGLGPGRRAPDHERLLRPSLKGGLRAGGMIDKYIGDNVMALFGVPEAHEDDPARALRALAMQGALAKFSERLKSVDRAPLSPCASASTPAWSSPREVV